MSGGPMMRRAAMWSSRRWMSAMASGGQTDVLAPRAQQVSQFPSLLIGPRGRLSPLGSFAQAQAAFLSPPPSLVDDLLAQLLSLNVGIVAHYYMDVELQGVLHAVRRRHAESTSSDVPIVAVADSLQMGQDALAMCRSSGVTSLLCLGVDFMAESVSAILSQNGMAHIPVYRASHKHIGCSLAASAESTNYPTWLNHSLASAASRSQRSLHLIYINTSLETKAMSSSIMPTITCTSSNVLQTILQATAQVNNLQICYGPDTYMGHNLLHLLRSILQNPHTWTDDNIQRDLHPLHSRSTLQTLHDNMQVYPSGNCVVHHMFGESVVHAVTTHYQHAMVTAHLEVPGEMFQIALQKSLTGHGCVGSTSDILKFIQTKVHHRLQANNTHNQMERLTFILGTEAGMITSIVRSVQDILDSTKDPMVEVEIVFPVSSEAVMAVEQDDTTSLGLDLVPGVSGGEGCSTAGGCATCPFMKMNDLEAVQDVLDMIEQMRASTSAANSVIDLKLQRHLPPTRLKGKMIQGKNAIELGMEPIDEMRHFMKEKRLSDRLLQKIEETRGRGVDETC